MLNEKNEVILKPLEVVVRNGNFEAAVRIFKKMVNEDGILALLKEKSRFEKPSVKRRRKQREASERVFLANLREKQIASGEWEQRQKKKEQARAKKLQDRKNKAESSND